MELVRIKIILMIPGGGEVLLGGWQCLSYCRDHLVPRVSLRAESLSDLTPGSLCSEHFLVAIKHSRNI